jgi:hypothetical protein
MKSRGRIDQTDQTDRHNNKRRMRGSNHAVAKHGNFSFDRWTLFVRPQSVIFVRKDLENLIQLGDLEDLHDLRNHIAHGQSAIQRR